MLVEVRGRPIFETFIDINPLKIVSNANFKKWEGQ